MEVAADAVVLSLGFRPDNHLVEELKEKGIHAQAIGNAVKDGTIAPASRSGFEAARKLFKTSVKTPSFITAPEEMPNFGKISLMKIRREYILHTSPILRRLQRFCLHR